MRSLVPILSILSILPLAVVASVPQSAYGQPLTEPRACIYPEQRDLAYRPPLAFPEAETPPVTAIPTVTDPLRGRPTYLLSLNEVLRIAICNCQVVRVMNSVTATSTGNTVYDPAIINTQIDEARGRFDPRLTLQNNARRTDGPSVVADAIDPAQARFIGAANESTTTDAALSKTGAGGGTATLGMRATRSEADRFGLLLNPQTNSALDLTFTQPLLRGRGTGPNLAPIVLARIDTERSVYQLQDSVQSLVRSVVDGYWGIVFARTDLWARQQQIKQLEFAYDYFSAQKKSGRGDLGDTAQALVSLSNFRASLITAEADLINREEALSNALGIPPGSGLKIIPSTPPSTERFSGNLTALLAAGEQNRPDIVNAKLVLEADRQRLLLAKNNTLPQVDANALYRWNSLQGTTPNGTRITSQGGEFADWLLGANLSVALGVRSERAGLRRAELSLARDGALLEQQIHAMTHDIAASVRTLEQLYQQYKAFGRVRSAAEVNLRRQFDLFSVGGIRTEPVTYLNVLLAVTDWGNSISNEARSLTSYNAELARLDELVGVILQRHGIRFWEIDFASQGPRYFGPAPAYPSRLPPTQPSSNYPNGDKASEESFDLKSSLPRSGNRRPLPSK